MSKLCQVADIMVRDDLPCPATESGGVQCERLDPHDNTGHDISAHTIAHYLAGNGYPCTAITPRVQEDTP